MLNGVVVEWDIGDVDVVEGASMHKGLGLVAMCVTWCMGGLGDF